MMDFEKKSQLSSSLSTVHPSPFHLSFTFIQPYIHDFKCHCISTEYKGVNVTYVWDIGQYLEEDVGH